VSALSPTGISLETAWADSASLIHPLRSSVFASVVFPVPENPSRTMKVKRGVRENRVYLRL